jgi:8-oxo-dGTP pyrophosphatase MutT (NUDIX family)
VTTVEAVGRVEARLVPFRWTWAEANRDAIAANWERRRERTPAIFNGRVLMVASLRVAAGTLSAEFFETDYANLLGHIDAGFADGSVANGFAMGALRSQDRAFLLGIMGKHTANAGRLYFPAGTPDLSDVGADGSVDLTGSILRELREETGLDPGLDALAPAWTIVRHAGRVAFMRAVQLEIGAEEARERILAHLAAEPEPELDGIVIVRGPEDIEAERMPDFLPVFLRSAFAGDAPQR